MATLTPRTSSSVVLGTSETTIITAAEITLAARIRLTNVTAGAITVTIHVVPSGGSASDSNAHLKGYSIPANDYIDIDLGNLPDAAVVSGLASAGTSITAHFLSGVERA